MNKRIAVLAWMVGLGLAWAQVSPEAAQLLERARSVLGGAALTNLNTYREVTTNIYYLPDGKEESRIVTLLLVDFGNRRVRLELYDPESLNAPNPIPLALQQYSPQESFFWSRETSLRPLPQDQREILRSSLYTGWLGLKYGSSNRERASVTQGSLRNQAGRLLTVSTQGWVSTYLFNPDGLLLGERLIIPGVGESITFFSNYRLVQGVRLPHSWENYVGGVLAARGEVMEVEINPVLGEGDFFKPLR
ncbi:hypothetical protein [Meiothermus taiwanensis]|jgi:hypothetical protein|uniref:Outer membrane lipoprotein-sorting protein n=2 Tax=Meiothermus taiwanensis TaxID=172827 RepID=A0A399E898_9DEIN|nr:hypothetical protein [Meiothermus taiwanensis]AWR86855.1 hypothetical protein Mtai_v1c16160 [Meiothermus taiwanensis WR-220]KIQ55025.1 hypothetical protein SY28_05490 [Meiothermus taiwanensis]KZK14753.1 hypothetical protein A3962_03410 [Meiothermus taiwanensis]RIH79389.1 hypothetical protein Mcate_00386 [Meiothermus taiwanensis]